MSMRSCLELYSTSESCPIIRSSPLSLVEKSTAAMLFRAFGDIPPFNPVEKRGFWVLVFKAGAPSARHGVPPKWGSTALDCWLVGGSFRHIFNIVWTPKEGQLKNLRLTGRGEPHGGAKKQVATTYITSITSTHDVFVYIKAFGTA